MMSDSASRGQSTTVLVIVGTAIILGALVIGIAIAGGFVSLSSVSESQSTPAETQTPTQVPTTIFSTPTIGSTRTQTQTPTPTSTPSPTSTPTVTPTPWPTATTRVDPYEEFNNAMLYALKEEAAVPIRFRGMRVVDDDLVFVVNYTAKSEDVTRRKQERSQILVGFAITVHWYDTDVISGKAPTGIQILEIDNTDVAPKYTYASYDNTLKWYDNNITSNDYYDLVTLSIRNQTTEERKLVESIDSEWENRTYHNESESLYGE